MNSTDSGRAPTEDTEPAPAQAEALSNEIRRFCAAVRRDVPEEMRDDALAAERVSRTMQKEFYARVRQKVTKLVRRNNILNLKYKSSRYQYDRAQIGIIVVSTLLTVYETVTAQMQQELTKLPSAGKHVMALLPAFFSSVIAIVASVLKFKRYQERMEMQIRAMDRAIACIFNMKQTLEQIYYASSLAALDAIHERYLDAVYPEYCLTNKALEHVLKYADVVKHMREFNQLHVDYRSSMIEHEARCLNMERTPPSAMAPSRTCARKWTCLLGCCRC